MNELQIFNNPNFGEIRTIDQNGEPWFVAKDICEILEIANTTQALGRLDDDERALLNIGRQGDANIVNEYGLYTLVLGSRKPEAKEFKRWITHEVIPSIRKTGSYNKPMTMLEIIAANAQALVDHDRQIKEMKQDMQGIREIVAINPKTEWRHEASNLISKMSKKIAGDYSKVQELRTESYKLLNERMSVDLHIRLTNKRRRMAEEGVCKTKRDALNGLDVIADDKKLIEGYIAIVKEMAIKYGI